MQKKLFNRLVLFLGMVLHFVIFVNFANGASLSILPITKNVFVGDTFDVKVLVTSAQTPMNASGGVLTFPPALLNVVNVIKDNSLFTLWPYEPYYNNTLGEVHYEGILLNPGFMGTNAKILTVRFRALAGGTARVGLTNAVVLANDGEATNILNRTIQNVEYLIQDYSLSQSIKMPLVKNGAPKAPYVWSNTHSSSTQWYSNSDVSLQWTQDDDVVSVETLLNRNALAIPMILNDASVTSKQIDGLQDGEYYFHIRAKNNIGWGEITHFKINIDTTRPYNMRITEVPRQDLTEPTIKFTIHAKDDLSGIDTYNVIVIGENTFKVYKDLEQEFSAKLKKTGTNTILALATDKAGNKVSDVLDLYVKPLESPVITKYSSELTKDELLEISGFSIYPESEIMLNFKTADDNAQTYITSSDFFGEFKFVSRYIDVGDYKVSVAVRDNRGAMSDYSVPIKIKVKSTLLFSLVNPIYTKSVLSILFMAWLIILLLIIIMFRKLQEKQVRKKKKDKKKDKKKSLVS